MQPFKAVDAVAVPIAMANVDTDQIIPARFLWRKRSDGWGQLLFHDLRFRDDGAAVAEFALNRREFRDAGVLVAQRNFGCGSSREHAVWALFDYGVRAVIAPSFGDIFRNNCYQNALLPIVLGEAQVARLIALLLASPGARVRVDLERQTVTTPDAGELAFEIDPFRKQCLLAGTDEIGFTLARKPEIAAFEADCERRMPWLSPPS
jgi:3-isopropylmalate/(R)-2-methylmalate dehydratase small subunit